jgi:hypothetical protein
MEVKVKQNYHSEVCLLQISEIIKQVLDNYYCSGAIEIVETRIDSVRELVSSLVEILAEKNILTIEDLNRLLSSSSYEIISIEQPKQEG